MRAVFEQELNEVQDRFVEISELVLDVIRDAITAFNAVDITLANRVISADYRIDRLPTELDELAIQILGKQNPVARDPRLIVGALRISAALERMGDLAQLARRSYPDRVASDALRDTFVAMAAQDVRTVELLTRPLRSGR